MFLYSPASAEAARTTTLLVIPLTGEATLTSPVQSVWRHVINYQAWQDLPHCRRISGNHSTRDDVVFLQNEPDDYYYPSHYVTPVNIVPTQRAIWKVFLSHTPDSDYFGFIDLRLREIGNATCMLYNLLYEFRVSHSSVAELEAFRARRTAELEHRYSKMWRRLELLTKDTGRHLSDCA